MKKQRQQGPYWVKLNKVWYVGMYYSDKNMWELFDNVDWLTDDDFEEIDGKQIKRKSLKKV